MKQYKPINSQFINTYRNIINNTLQFENICSIEPVTTDSNMASKYNLQIWECELLTTYLPSIIENANMITFSSLVVAQKYYNNPHRLSMDNFGVSDYWFLILAMNNYQSRFDFHDFIDQLLLPNANYINQIITGLEKIMLDVTIQI